MGRSPEGQPEGEPPDPPVLAALLADPRRSAGVTHVERRPARPGRAAAWPGWADPLLVDRLQSGGIPAPWLHQVEAAEHAMAGRHVVVSTGTGSGKSLAYQLPVLSTLRADPRARALYLSPTKALAADQLRAVGRLDLPGVRAAGYDGDTPAAERDWARAHANWILSNPDMLHRGMLPQHARFRSFFAGLRFVVVDECHSYRGVFGSQVAQVLRRLRRVCGHYGAEPTVVLASATVADPAGSARLLTGLPVSAVTEDAAPRGPLVFVLFAPPRGPDGAPRRPWMQEAAELLADLVRQGARTLAFVGSRRGAELLAAGARTALDAGAGSPDQVAAYRGGYLPEERRALEARLQSGELRGLATTSALELGLDVSGLDAVVLAGFPGTLASLWQQAGRAGRAGQRALAILVARDDPLDTFLVHHPPALFGRPVEATVLDPSNPHVLAPHLECAAAELPLTGADLAVFDGAGPVLDRLVAEGRLRRRPTGWFWARHGHRPDADLRGGSGQTVALVEQPTGRLLGTVDGFAAHRSAHPGAVYLHQGETYLVEDLDLEAGVALVRAAEPDWTTAAREHTALRVTRWLAGAGDPVRLAEAQVTAQVVSYRRIRLGTGEVLDEIPLDLPPRHLATRAVVCAIPDETLARVGLRPAAVAGAAHAAEHAAIGLLPLFAGCDRWDIGGISSGRHPDTGHASVFVYDGYPGGAGFAERGYGQAGAWLSATRDAVRGCSCPAGCPACVQSPRCGSGNQPLDKAGAITLLDAVVSGTSSSPPGSAQARNGGAGGDATRPNGVSVR